MIDATLASYATPRQLEFLEAIEVHGSARKAALALGLNPCRVAKSMLGLRRRAAVKGHSPEHDMTHTVPDPYVVKGVSTYYNKEGKPAGQWVKSRLDDARREAAMRLAAQVLADDLPRLEPMPQPSDTADQLCTLYTLTDCHVGMLAWHKEGGADWDLKIAEETLSGCFAQMVMRSPDASTAIVAQLGDFLHADGLLPLTPTSGNVLDVDGRFGKVVAVAVRILRRIISMALGKHKRVIVLLAEGNHDPAASVWLRVMFRALFENEPRVEVVDSELPYYCYRHGKTMLGFHHGHLSKPASLPILFAAQFSEVWGGTTKRYIHTGHRHFVEEREHSGVTVIQHPTLASRDAYAARGGWIAERQVTAITYHAEYGQVGRITITPEMLDAGC